MRIPAPDAALAAAVTVVAAALCGPVHAQYKWRDESGQLVISDQPPPSSVPGGRVIRGYEAPQRATAPAAAGSAAAAGSGSTTAAADAPPTGPRESAGAPAAAPTVADRMLEARRKQQERDAERKKREEEARQASAQAARTARVCADQDTNVRTLESGMRLVRVNESGEREYLTDEERSAQLERIRKEMKEHCGKGR